MCASVCAKYGYLRYGNLSKIGNRKHYNVNKTLLKRTNIIPSSREKTYVLVASTGLEGCVDELASMIVLLVLLPFRSTMLLRESQQAFAAHGGCLPA